MFQLDTDRLLIRNWEKGDWEHFKPIASDPLMLRYIGDGRTWSKERTRNFVDRQIENYKKQKFCRWKLVHKESNSLMGFCGLGYFGNTGEIEIGWWVAREFWGQGLASEAAAAVMRYGLDELAIKRLISVARPENLPSIRIMEKLGFHEHERTTCQALGVPYPGIFVVVYAMDAPV